MKISSFKTQGLLLLTLVLSASFAHADASVRTWTKNYNALVKILKTTKSVGNCTVSLSQTAESQNTGWIVNFLRTEEGLTGFMIESPASTHGETQVDVLSQTMVRYRQSDMAGWSNMFVRLGSDQKTIIGIKVNKTLPDDTAYGNGIVCGSIP